jgi:hypothetical protein
MKRAAVVLVLAGLALGAGPAGAAAMPRNLKLGVTDPVLSSSDAGLRDEWMAKAENARADIVLLGVNWSSIAPARRPAGFDAVNPADSAYDWETLDRTVRSVVAQGMQPLLAIDFAPAWAEGPNRPSLAQAPAGTWLPQPQELGLFAQAIAARYSGSFVDPANPAAGSLPRVRYFQIWGEENLSVHLNPLWEGQRLVAPQHYREMLNAAYAGIHRANSGARVIVGGLAPYGDAMAGGSRIPPVWFWRSLLCLRGARLKPIGCPHPAHFDIAAHNPINVLGPSSSAFSPLDVSTPDIGRLTKIVKKAVAKWRALPAKRKPFWATEIWWDSRPPDPQGVPLFRHARFLSVSLFELWRRGVSAVIWWYLRDQDPGTAGFPATQQSGLFFREGQPKPALRAFRFPFVARRDKHGQVLLWGKAPCAGGLAIERRTPSGWVALAHPLANSNGLFLTRLDIKAAFRVRAKQGRRTSLPWRVHASR